MQSSTKKKRIQVQLDQTIADNATMVFEELGINPTTAITLFYSRVAAEGKLPFDVALTEREKANLALTDAFKGLPNEEIATDQELKDWINESEEY
ncbi:type II toxin-antitoxin system RelB/DinJ family antitoxin [Lactobacillus sp. ESL0684]|uniref:type II toxin-antitoxin system RelB/DinJ family antitoxin n=1 Tax=Lactobacillus sp. ESL0684 TaxID=2983213 RepID=UPI0023F83B54|nr:type II toxin-antitoxin system RelB/DinJ family antitoxin [Lactobacillus sp. ESL0684]WEV44198.1 type II toxin-antitoxin system RelB/DinJ family antitoxin [Lactobacillus sp. ESL0684]